MDEEGDSDGNGEGGVRRLSSSSCIGMTFALYATEELDGLNIAQWRTGDTEDYSFVCHSWNGSAWTTDGFNHAKTTVDYENKTAYCCATANHQESTVTYQKAGSVVEVASDNDIIVVEPKGSSDDDDDYEYM